MSDVPMESSLFTLDPGQHFDFVCGGPGRMAITVQCGTFGTIKFWVRREDPARFTAGRGSATVTIQQEYQVPVGWPFDHEADTTPDGHG